MRRGINRPIDVADGAGWGNSYPANAANKQKAFWRWRYLGPTIVSPKVLIGNTGEYRDSGDLTAGVDRVVAFFYVAQLPWSFDFAAYDISATQDDVGTIEDPAPEAEVQFNLLTFVPPFFSNETFLISENQTGYGTQSISGSFASAVFPATDSPLGVLIAYKNSGEIGSYSVQFDVQAIT